MDKKSNDLSFQAGKAQGQAQEKAKQIVDNAGSAAQSAKESIVKGGQVVQEKAQGAVDAVKNATGLNK